MKPMFLLAVLLGMCRTAAAQQLVRGGASSGNKMNPLVSTNTPGRASRAGYIRAAGGIVHLPASGAPLVVLDATARRVAAPSFQTMKKTMDEYDIVSMRLDDVPAAERTACAADALAFARSRAKGAAGVVLLTDGGADAPALAVYPEERIAVIATDALCAGARGSGVREDRVTRELWRAVGFMFGAGYAQQYECVMKPVSDVSELDTVRLKFIHPQGAFAMREAFRKAGAVPARHGTYRQAVKGGWAPMPTNEIQRAIWEKQGK